MDAYEATKTVMSRIRALDPGNTSKIMGFILIQDQADKEMIRLAFSPDAILLSYINRAKARLGLPQNPPRILIPTNGGVWSPIPAPYATTGPGFGFYGGGGDEYLGSRSDPAMSPAGMSDSLVFPHGEDAGGGISSPEATPFHKRSCSVNDAAFLSNLEEGGCKFFHGGGDGVGSPKNVSGFDELMRMKALQQQRFAAMGGHIPFAYNRQIYLTFPAESTFKEEDITNYFSMFGPVQDVRIPYQQKRMFGFVTFVYPETVEQILAKGNPHLVCDSRVLVKPYKEKVKFREKKQYAHHLDNTPFGPRMLLSPRDLMLRRKFEHEAEMQHAIELEGRRMMNLKLMDPNNEKHHFRYLHGFPHSFTRNSEFLINNRLTSSSDSINQENSEEFDGGHDSLVGASKKFPEGTEFSASNNRLRRGNSDDSDVHESLLEHNLHYNLFASPTNSAAENHSGFPEANTGSVEIATPSNGNLAPPKSCHLQMQSFLSGQEAIKM